MSKGELIESDLQRNPASAANRSAAQLWFEAAASWDEDHAAPIVEYLKEFRGDSDKALAEVQKDLKNGRAQWDLQYREEAKHLGVETSEAHRWYVERYLRDSQKRLAVTAARKNPATPEVRTAAIEKYKEFHRYEPKKLTEFPGTFAIPREVVRAGRAKWTTYRSSKVDPSTLQKPKRPVAYIHEHDPGVTVYFTADAPELDELDIEDETMISVPPEFCDAQALVKLGDSLGFCIKGEDGEEDAEFESSGKLPELYCTPDGRCLLVIQNQREVLAMLWGGKLGVFSRGIDG